MIHLVGCNKTESQGRWNTIFVKQNIAFKALNYIHLVNDFKMITLSKTKQLLNFQALNSIQEQYAGKLKVDVRLLSGEEGEEISEKIRAIIGGHQVAHTKLQQRILLTRVCEDDELMKKTAKIMKNRKDTLIEQTDEMMFDVEDELAGGKDIKDLEPRLQQHLLNVTQVYKEDWNTLTQVHY